MVGGIETPGFGITGVMFDLHDCWMVKNMKAVKLQSMAKSGSGILLWPLCPHHVSLRYIYIYM